MQFTFIGVCHLLPWQRRTKTLMPRRESIQRHPRSRKGDKTSDSRQIPDSELGAVGGVVNEHF